MSVLYFAAPHCNYCLLQKDCKIKLDKEFNSKLFEALKDITLPKCIRIELNCAHFSPNKDAFKMLIKENGDIECLGLNEEDKLCRNMKNR